MAAFLVSSCAHQKDVLEGKITEVVVIGTFHGLHWKMAKYSLENLEQLIRRARPEVLAVEARPEDLSKANFGPTPPDIAKVAIPLARRLEISRTQSAARVSLS